MSNTGDNVDQRERSLSSLPDRPTADAWITVLESLTAPTRSNAKDRIAVIKMHYGVNPGDSPQLTTG